MKDDTISRQAAISEIMEDIKDRSLHDDPATPEDYAEGYDEGIRNAAAIVLQMPSAQPGWIPCTPETMPEEDGEYLCTVYRAIPPYHMFHPEENVYVKTVEVKEYRASSGFPSSVKAWQPKPKPWEGGQDGE